MNEQLNTLKENLMKLENAIGFPHGRIKIYIEDKRFAIDVDNTCWSNYLDFYEADCELVSLFKGIALGKGMKWKTYMITEESLNEIVQFALGHPDTIFSTEPMDDGSPFLSCAFFTRDEDGNSDDLASGYWELDGREA